MKNTTMLILIVIVIVSVGAFVFVNGTAKENFNEAIAENNDNSNIQKINLGIKDYNYYPNTIKVKEGIPVRISLDKSVTGCLRSFTIRDFGVAKVLRTPEDYVEFIPDKKGTFTFACSMGMGRGKIIVE